ncbi:hypothetical protein C882_2835 [Caenispirillum salinarum AK4]|uniref:Uncharacterized protein n=1 Tax=Caenispirillum salinarum AK4 TaxID=1238182 RepID=K9GME8_9PROT|nr:hypothetical protein [Caenispirillum salinarum]EKV26257.1 hypothetical protein C882_2835 [Caenispirillum salinarum AK4]
MVMRRISAATGVRWRGIGLRAALLPVLLMAALLLWAGPAAAQADIQAQARPGADGAGDRLAEAEQALCGPAAATADDLRVAAAAMAVQGLEIRSALAEAGDGGGDLTMLPAGSPVRLSVERQGDTGSLLRVYAVESEADRLQGMRRMGQSQGANGPEVIAILEPLKELWAIWPSYTVYVVGCSNAGPDQPAAITFIARTDTGVSEPLMAGSLAVAVVGLLYLGACLMVASATTAGFTINPVRLTAGADGRASISKLQILFFTLIISGMLIYVLLRIGVLGDLSSDVLTLLGIAGVSAVAANQTAVGRRRLSGSNWAWLKRQGWQPEKREPSAGDLVTEQGEFDIYRFQTLVFSLVVGLSLLFTGLFGLSSFELSPALLGLLGISQTIYVGGKAVSKPQIGELNKKIDALRKAARESVEAQDATGGAVGAAGQPAAAPAAAPSGHQLTADLRDVASMTRDVLGGTWTLPATVEPSSLT